MKNVWEAQKTCTSQLHNKHYLSSNNSPLEQVKLYLKGKTGLK